MEVNFSTIKQNAKNITTTTVGKATEFGKETRTFAKGAFKAAKDKADSFQVVKNATEKLKEKNINKDTALGAGVAIVAVVLATKCLKGIIGKIAEIGKK